MSMNTTTATTITATAAALDHYQKLTDLVKQHFDTLPSQFQTLFTKWETDSAPILSNLSVPSSQLQLSDSNITNLLIKDRLKPHEIQKLRQQTLFDQDTLLVQSLDALITNRLTDPNFTLPLLPSLNDPSGNNTILSATLDWTSLGIKKSKTLKDKTIVFAMAGLLRGASAYLHKTVLFEPEEESSLSMSDDSVTNKVEEGQEVDGKKSHKPISAPSLAQHWATFLIPLIQQDIDSQQQQMASPSLSTSTQTGDITSIWKSIKPAPPTNTQRQGNIDFYFDSKLYKSLTTPNIDGDITSSTCDNTNDDNNNNNNDNNNNNIEDKSPNVKKRKPTPLTNSPQLTPSTSKPKTSTTMSDEQDITTTATTTNNNNDGNNSSQSLVSLQEDKVYQEIAGLFDFAPTTGESRHCINPDTKDLQQFQFTAMGYINSCYRAKFSTPRQGNAAPSSHASLTLHNDVRFHSLLGLEQYSHVWLLFVFHSNAQGSYRPKITPPRLGERVGCLATRSPHRWNDIGLSLVKLDKIEYPENFQHLPMTHPSRQFFVHTPGINSKATHLPGCARLILSNVDLIDGTPILDVKPFNPGDMIPDPKSLRLPDWLASAPLFTLNITFHQQATNDLFDIFNQYYQTQLTTLTEKATKFHHGIETNDPKLKLMDKPTFAIYSRQYEHDRVSKLKQSLESFQQFNPANQSSSSSQPPLANTDGNQPRDKLQEHLSHELGSPLQFYPTISAIQQAIIDTLRNDPRPIWTKYENRNRAIFGFLYDNLNIVYQMNGDTDASVCFLQHRDEYISLCEQLKTLELKGNDGIGDKNFQTQLTKKRGWVQLIKAKITKTTIDPTDDWAKDVHREQQLIHVPKKTD